MAIRSTATLTAILLVPLIQAADATRGDCKLFPVATETGLGYIDRSGKLKLRTPYDRGEYFSEGLAVVERDGKCGFIDESGRLIVAPRFDDAHAFKEGLARVRVGDKYGYVNRNGNVAITPRYCHALDFAEGLAAVTFDCIPSVAKWFFITNTGEVANPGPFRWPRRFSEGVALVDLGTVLKPRWAFIKHNGEIAFELPSGTSHHSSFSEGLALIAMMTKGSKTYGYIDKSGQQRITQRPGLGPVYVEGMLDFSGGLALVEESRKYGYIDVMGQYRIRPRFDDALPFAEGMAAVRVGTKWGFIDASGRFSVRPQFEQAWSFCGGLARVATAMHVGYVDTGGHYRWRKRKRQ